MTARPVAPRSAAILAATALAACTLPAFGDAVPGEYLAPQWMLLAIDGQPFAARATIDLTEPGRAFGEGPCNRWSASYKGTLPAFVPGGVMATKMACPDMGAEAAFFSALSAMTVAATKAPDRLILTGPGGRSMEFIRPMN